MDLKKLFPISYEKPVLTAVIIYLIALVIASALIWVAGLLTGWIPLVGTLVGWVLRIAGILVDVYVVAGIVVKLLLHFEIMK